MRIFVIVSFLIALAQGVLAKGPGAAPPTVTAVSPATGRTAGGTIIEIAGTNFTGATDVTIGGTAATEVSVIDDTTITCTTPTGTAGAAGVVVTTPCGANAANTLFTYGTPNTAPSFSLPSGPLGPAGAAWTAQPNTGTRGWNSIASSADGTKLAASVFGGQIYTSTDSGVSWAARDSNRAWMSITSSADGTKLAAVEYFGGT